MVLWGVRLVGHGGGKLSFFNTQSKENLYQKIQHWEKKLLYDQNIRINKPFSPTFILCLQLAGHSQPHLKLRDTLLRHRDELILASVMFTVLLIQQDLQMKQPKLLFVPEVWFHDGSLIDSCRSSDLVRCNGRFTKHLTECTDGWQTEGAAGAACVDIVIDVLISVT